MKRRQFIGVAASAGAVASGLRPARAATAPIRIGVLTDMNNGSADMSGAGSVAAARLAIADAGGSALGQPIELIFGDHQMKPDVGGMIASKWYDTQGVDLIADVPFSAVGLAVQGIARQRKKLLIVSGTGADEFTGKLCSPYGMQWTFDSSALANGTAATLLARGAKSFYFITPDYAFGHSMERVATALIKAKGGTVAGHSIYPFGTPDMSSYLLAAQASGADVIAISGGPPDNVNAVKQAASFGIGRGRQQLAAMLAFINDIHAIGLPVAQGLVLTTSFYWDRDAATRAWSARFNKETGKMPSMTQAGVYSGVLHYLKAVQATGTRDADAVAAKMRATKVDDMFAQGGVLRPDGLMVHDLLLVRAKAPAQSKGPWDLYEILSRIPGNEAFPPLKSGGCPLVAG
ncbi:MAG TPA: ABC transporter substrate-binding protein [Rhodopila sp.]|nr:ABC transporter substrate-binding protein [Rhodopila sp.]